jgi:hypothetical protein
MDNGSYGSKNTLSRVFRGGMVGNLLHFFWQQYIIFADDAMMTRFAMWKSETRKV